MIYRAHSVLTVKTLDDDKRLATGIASTPTVDSQNDVLEPLGAVWALPLPLLLMHDPMQPIGQVISATASESGIAVTCQFAKADAPPRLRDELDHVWGQVKNRLLRGLSVGFQALEWEPLQGGGTRFTKWQWRELSACVLPANLEATIVNIKALDTHMPVLARATSGLTPVHRERLSKMIGDLGLQARAAPGADALLPFDRGTLHHLLSAISATAHVSVMAATEAADAAMRKALNGEVPLIEIIALLERRLAKLEGRP